MTLIGWADKDFLLWRSIIDAIPSDWKSGLLRQKGNPIKEANSKTKLYLCRGGEFHTE